MIIAVQNWRLLGLFACIAGAIPPAPTSAAGGAVCSVSATPLVFGQYVPARGGSSDFTATVTVTCARSEAASVEATIALVGGGGSGGRELSDGLHRLRYQLYLDPARTIPWGDGSGDTRTRSVELSVGSTAPARQSYTVYGRIRGRQSQLMVGHYSDQVTVILNY
jgi:spore coat protein U-like protein